MATDLRAEMPSDALAVVDVGGGADAAAGVTCMGSCFALATGISIPGGIAVDATNVYGVPQPPSTPRTGAYALAVDAANIYFTLINGTNDTVCKVPRSGGAAVPLAMAQQRPQGIVVDATNAYWVNYVASGEMIGTVMKVPLAAGTTMAIAEHQYNLVTDGTTHKLTPRWPAAEVVPGPASPKVWQSAASIFSTSCVIQAASECPEMGGTVMSSSRSRMRVIVAGALSLGLGACQGPDDSESVGVVRAALNDAGKFTTKHGAQVAGTESTDHINVAWTATDASGKSQIVGQAFNNVTGESFGTPPAPGSVIYSCPAAFDNHCTSVNANNKSFPAIAWEQPDSYTALLVWQEDVAGEAVHSKIMGVIVVDDGSRRGSPTPFVIYDKAGEQAWKPWVTVVPTASGNAWLVTYTRRVPIGGGAYDAVLSTSLVDSDHPVAVFNGDVVGKGKGVNPAASRPTASYDSSRGVLYTWNDSKFVFTNGVSDLGYRSAVETVAGAAGIVGASNEYRHSYAVAYKKGTTVHGRPFKNCTAQSCSFDATLFTTGNGVNALTNPVISTYGPDFGIVTGETLASGPGQLSITIMDSSGNFIPIFNGLNDTCPAALKGTIGSPNTLAAFQKRADVDARVFFLYGTYCDQQHKIRASGRSAYDLLDNLAFDVAD